MEFTLNDMLAILRGAQRAYSDIVNDLEENNEPMSVFNIKMQSKLEVCNDLLEEYKQRK